ncbi:HAD family hydrolase [Mycobacterium kyorinense]|uniref:HAD family hydrolase n=1 Tax=Mycobacterium kyorinense TaxID=487514 RepID=UPI00084BEE35
MGVQTTARRTFWWDRAPSVDADVHPLRAVIFYADALDDLDGEPRAGLIDLVMSLFVAGIWVGVVSRRRRAWAETRVRHLVGEGLVETLVTADDLAQPGSDVELYQLALWELGITPAAALAFTGTGRGLRAAVAAGLPAEFRAGYDDLSAADCQQLHRRWWIRQKRAGARREARPANAASR